MKTEKKVVLRVISCLIALVCLSSCYPRYDDEVEYYYIQQPQQQVQYIQREPELQAGWASQYIDRPMYQVPQWTPPCYPQQYSCPSPFYPGAYPPPCRPPQMQPPPGCRITIPLGGGHHGRR